MRAKDYATSSSQGRLSGAGSGQARVFLAKKLPSAPRNLPAGLGICRAQAAVCLLSDHCLMNHRLVHRHSKDVIAQLGLFDYLARSIMNWKTHRIIP